MSGLTEARELKERVRTLSIRQQEITATAEAEDRDLNSEEEQEYDRLHDEQESLIKRAKRLVSEHDREQELEERLRFGDANANGGDGLAAGDQDTDGDDRGGGGGGGPVSKEKRARQMRAFENVMVNDFEPDDIDEVRDMGLRVSRNGTVIRLNLWDGLRANRAARAQLETRDRVIDAARRSQVFDELRAMSTSATAGGDTIPETLVAMIERQLLAFGGMREVGARIVRTATGEPMDVPTDDDTGNTGELLAENNAANEQDITTGQKTLNAYKYSSKMIRVSRELLQDTAVDLPTYLGEALGERIGRITNSHFTTANGSSKPNGVVNAATSAATTALATTVSYDELVDLQHSVDPAYRRQDPRFMFSDATLKALKKLKDGDGKPLWVSGLAVREPDTILGDPYTINQDVADIASAAKAIIYGAFRYFWIRDVMDITLLRLDERYAEFFQVAWVAFSRHDSELISEAAGPIKFLTQAT